MLSVTNLSLSYGASQILRNVGFEAPSGEVTCILGRNGVGKTSLLRAIMGHRPISSGAIRFEGREIAGLKPYERAALGIGYVPQGREIFPRRACAKISKPVLHLCPGGSAMCPTRSSSSSPSSPRC